VRKSELFFFWQPSPKFDLIGLRFWREAWQILWIRCQEWHLRQRLASVDQAQLSVVCKQQVKCLPTGFWRLVDPIIPSSWLQHPAIGGLIILYWTVIFLVGARPASPSYWSRVWPHPGIFWQRISWSSLETPAKPQQTHNSKFLIGSVYIQLTTLFWWPYLLGFCPFIVTLNPFCLWISSPRVNMPCLKPGIWKRVSCCTCLVYIAKTLGDLPALTALVHVLLDSRVLLRQE
jgi:hypothetical protein